MKNESIKSNFLFQIIYQIIILVIPLVLAPYLARTLGDVQIGEYTYSYTIAYYFVLLAMLGINKYGQRSIATSKSDEIKLRKEFWSLYLIHAFFSLLSFVFYLLIFVIILSENRLLYLILGIYVISALFDVTWLFYGLEKFKSIVLRNALVKIIECLCIFIFVKKPGDIYIYTIIMSSSILLGQLLVLPIVFKNIKFIKVTFKDIKKHIIPLLVFSISVISATLYTVFDKTLLGLLSTKSDVAYYEYANKIISVPKSIVLVVGNVIFPRACLTDTMDNQNQTDKYYKYALIFTYFVCFASIFGLFSVSNLFSDLYFGESFSKCADLMKYLSFMILIISFGDIIRNMFIIPYNKDLFLTICVLSCAFVNIILSIIFIRLLGVMGAVIGTTVSELIALIVQIVYCKKKINFRITLKYLFPFLIAGGCMYLTIYFVKFLSNSNIISLLIQVALGALVYCTMLIIYFLVIDSEKNENKLLIKNIILRRRSK